MTHVSRAVGNKRNSRLSTKDAIYKRTLSREDYEIKLYSPSRSTRTLFPYLRYSTGDQFRGLCPSGVGVDRNARVVNLARRRVPATKRNGRIAWLATARRPLFLDRASRETLFRVNALARAAAIVMPRRSSKAFWRPRDSFFEYR